MATHAHLTLEERLHRIERTVDAIEGESRTAWERLVLIQWLLFALAEKLTGERPEVIVRTWENKSGDPAAVISGPTDRVAWRMPN